MLDWEIRFAIITILLLVALPSFAQTVGEPLLDPNDRGDTIAIGTGVAESVCWAINRSAVANSHCLDSDKDGYVTPVEREASGITPQ